MNSIFDSFLDVNPLQGGVRSLSTLLLYEELDKAILTRWADDILERIPDGSITIELGVGVLAMPSVRNDYILHKRPAQSVQSE